MKEAGHSKELSTRMLHAGVPIAKPCPNVEIASKLPGRLALG